MKGLRRRVGDGWEGGSLPPIPTIPLTYYYNYYSPLPCHSRERGGGSPATLVEGRVAGPAPYATLFRTEAARGGGSTLTHFLRDYVIKAHLSIYAEIECALRACAKPSTVERVLELVPIGRGNTFTSV
eukprot:gene12845-biopygen294